MRVSPALRLQFPMTEADKIRWQCRRGLLELDLILEKFNQQHLGSLDPEQLERFKDRLDDKSRWWKISETDYSEREYWSDYASAYEDALSNCSTKNAPWYVIPSDHKWFRNLAISQIIADKLETLRIQVPKPTVNLSDIRKKYHAAKKDDK